MYEGVPISRLPQAQTVPPHVETFLIRKGWSRYGYVTSDNNPLFTMGNVTCTWVEALLLEISPALMALEE